jgi:hypothetical protein
MGADMPASQHKPPAFRFLTKDEGSEELKEIGQVWATAKAEVYSVTLDLNDTGEKIRFMMVPNKPKPKVQKANAHKPAA